MIRTDKLSYEYEATLELPDGSSKVLALKDINIEIEQSSFVAILGHNGSGKSTFAKMINALLLPTFGEIYFLDRSTKIEENIEFIRKNAGMVFQNPDNQIIGTIVSEDVGFGPENLQVETEEIHERVNESLSKVDMLKYKDVSPNRLSGGQKQRVAIASTLAMKPKCIILDEPTAMLDPNGRKEVINTIYKLNKEDNVTIILITHYMEEVINADRVIVMNNGEIALDDEPRKIFNNIKKLEELNLELPEVTKLSMEISEELRNRGIELPICYTVDELVSEITHIRGGND